MIARAQAGRPLHRQLRQLRQPERCASAGRLPRRAPAATWRRATSKRFWDSPVPYEHTFECTYRNIGAAVRPVSRARPRPRRVDAVGHARLGAAAASAAAARAPALMERLDRVARRMPGLADFRAHGLAAARRGRDSRAPGCAIWRALARLTAAQPAPPPPRRRDDARHAGRSDLPAARRTKDRAWEEDWGLAPFLAARMQAAVPLENRALTGDARRSADGRVCRPRAVRTRGAARRRRGGRGRDLDAVSAAARRSTSSRQTRAASSACARDSPRTATASGCSARTSTSSPCRASTTTSSSPPAASSASPTSSSSSTRSRRR